MLTRVCRSCAHASRIASATRSASSPSIVARRGAVLIRANSSSSSSTSTSTSTSTPSTTSAGLKKPSPYRLIPVSTFLADFAPLHVKGWRLDNLPHVRHATQPKEGGMVELQDRHLTRRYDFQIGPEGWRDTLRFIAIIGEAIELEDHHPTINVSPAADVSTFPPLPKTVGYVISISTHTHTPLPPLKYSNKDESMRPGVTGKDMKLAARLEELYAGIKST